VVLKKQAFSAERHNHYVPFYVYIDMMIQSFFLKMFDIFEIISDIFKGIQILPVTLVQLYFISEEQTFEIT
jgi:hypothetical protein